MYCAFSARLEDIHMAAEKNKKFEGSADELNLPESNSEEVMASLDPSFKTKLKTAFSEFFSS